MFGRRRDLVDICDRCLNPPGHFIHPRSDQFRPAGIFIGIVGQPFDQQKTLPDRIDRYMNRLFELLGIVARFFDPIIRNNNT